VGIEMMGAVRGVAMERAWIREVIMIRESGGAR
jgi:hypothetical protein